MALSLHFDTKSLTQPCPSSAPAPFFNVSLFQDLQRRNLNHCQTSGQAFRQMILFSFIETPQIHAFLGSSCDLLCCLIPYLNSSLKIITYPGYPHCSISYWCFPYEAEAIPSWIYSQGNLKPPLSFIRTVCIFQLLLRESSLHVLNTSRTTHGTVDPQSTLVLKRIFIQWKETSIKS